MRVRRGVMVAAVVLLGAFACGCEYEGTGGIVGAQTAPAPSAGPTDVAGGETDRPPVRLPRDVKNVFEWQPTGDAAKDAVLKDGAARLDAISMAITSGDMRHSGMGFYSTGEAVESGYNLVKAILVRGRTVTGTTRYYGQAVNLHSAKSATLTYCSDENEVFLRERRTRRVLRDAPSPDNYVGYAVELSRAKNGVWQTAAVASSVGAKRCQP